jgi:hypothetical protein
MRAEVSAEVATRAPMALATAAPVTAEDFEAAIGTADGTDPIGRDGRSMAIRAPTMIRIMDMSTVAVRGRTTTNIVSE